MLAYGSRGYLRHQLVHMPQEPRQIVLSLGRSAEKASVESINASRSASAPRTGTSPSVKRSVIRVQYPLFDDWEDVASRSLIRLAAAVPTSQATSLARNARPGPQHPRKPPQGVGRRRVGHPVKGRIHDRAAAVGCRRSPSLTGHPARLPRRTPTAQQGPPIPGGPATSRGDRRDHETSRRQRSWRSGARLIVVLWRAGLRIGAALSLAGGGSRRTSRVAAGAPR